MSESILDGMEEAFSRGTPESRLRALWHATDALMTGSYSEAEIWVFGEVIGRLADEIEVAARAQLAKRLARTDHAPPNVLGKLALDHSIDVARPVLTQSGRLDVRALVGVCNTSSQQHLLAVSKRQSIPEAVTDVLVTRGDSEVVRSVAKNPGARFSEFGFLHLIKRSEGDSILAENLGLRNDIPRHLFQQLISKASEEAKRRLEQLDPQTTHQVKAVVADVTGGMHSKFGPATKRYFEAKKAVNAIHRSGGLRDKQVREFAQSHKFEETAVALSLLGGLPVDVTERVLNDRNSDTTLILSKAIGLSWDTTMALLFLHSEDHQMSGQELDKAERAFAKLDVEASRRVLDVYRSRKASDGEALNLQRLPQLHGV